MPRKESTEGAVVHGTAGQRIWNKTIQKMLETEERPIPEPCLPPPEDPQCLTLDVAQIVDLAKYVGVVPFCTEVINSYSTNQGVTIIYKYKD